MNGYIYMCVCVYIYTYTRIRIEKNFFSHYINNHPPLSINRLSKLYFFTPIIRFYTQKREIIKILSISLRRFLREILERYKRTEFYRGKLDFKFFI